ncbi:septum formation family protein [Dactylosporangium sp. AC04546]|uniref:septum formation family protein n=1 Tax=Dactylosporangium sp. AC04546 TaxID=2862460 RepID=UPI001EDFEFA4|nr:septum formation family protein [Dactylosporangium sp. AC04546]WVK84256.1 septum formation family protein [Dactylosporangium sp. AC04546]
MRRFLLAACALLVLGTAACAAPKGTDGNLVDDWPALPAPKVPEPAVGACWKTTAWAAYEQLAFEYTLPADCATEHHMETVHVGQVPADLASSTQVPSALQLSQVYRECEPAAEKYLGGAWQTGRVYLYLHPTTAAQWRGGARFYRCDVATVDSEADHLVPQTGTLKDSLRPGGPRAIGCGNQVVRDKKIVDLTPTACTDPHDTELVGYARRPDVQTIPPDYKGIEAIFKSECEAQLLAYTGMSASHYARQPVGIITWVTTNNHGWTAGDHSARCYLITNKKLTRSLKSAGNVAV